MRSLRNPLPLFALVILAGLVLAACSPHRFAPLTTDDVCGNPHYPIAEGAGWYYGHISADQPRAAKYADYITYTISDVIVTDRRTTFTRNIDDNPRDQMFCSEGVLYLDYTVILTTNLSQGKLAVPGTEGYHYEGEQTVTVPAGTFETEVVCNLQPGMGLRDCWYYAEGVGPVQHTLHIHDQLQDSLVLISYSVP